MNVKKAQATLDELYKYGESAPNDELSFLLEQELVYCPNNRWVISRTFVRYTYLFEKPEDCIHSLFCLEPEYKKNLLQHLLVTALQMRAAKNSRGISELINHLPKLAGQAVAILNSVYDEADRDYHVDRLESEIADSRHTYRERDLLLFKGEPEFQRLIFYLDRVQQVTQITEPPEVPMDSMIDEMWAAGRKISTYWGLPERKTRPEYVLAPFQNRDSGNGASLGNIIGRPWELFVFILSIIREQYEVEKDPAFALMEAGDGVQVMLTTRQGKELQYGSLDQFCAYLCRALDYELFPGRIPPAKASMTQLYEKGIMIFRDSKYLLNPEIEDKLYTTSLGLIFITNSKKLTARIRKFIDELRVVR